MAQIVNPPAWLTHSCTYTGLKAATWFDSYCRSFDAVWETALPIAEAEQHRLSPWPGRPGQSPRLRRPGPGLPRPGHHSTAP
jgi:hypothetical protein